MQNILQILQDIFTYAPAVPMLFNSGIFLVLFIIFVSVYAIIHKNRISVTLFVIAFSFFFYYKSSGIFISILAFTSVTDYLFALLIARTDKKFAKKLWLFFSVGSSLGILAFFKYTNFFLDNLTSIIKFFGDFPAIAASIQGMEIPYFKSFSEIMADNFQPLDIFLPIGISFYTFQSISYVIDVYRKDLPPAKNFLDYVFFLSFFPQLVAGPIVKANLFLPQLKKKITINKAMIWSGVWLIMIGLLKKAVIADYISQYNDFVFGAPQTYSGFENLMGVLGYALQIYCDFSGYSDMAIGLARVMGFDLGVNFNFPYKARNITDFWRRWHISLSSWLREYLYIPLGGNRKGTWKMYRNLFLTMFLGGLWHGANWKFVIWGAMHGIALAVHKLSEKWLDKLPNIFPTRFMSWAITFIFVITLWIFFRAADIPETTIIKTVKGASGYTFTSKTIAETDTTKTLRVYFYEGENLQDSLTEVLPFNMATKFRISEKDKADDKQVSLKAMISAFDVSFIVIWQILSDTDWNYAMTFDKDGKLSFPFWDAHRTWIILVLLGFLMHASPVKWNDKITALYMKSHFIIKLFLFIIIVQLVIQFKNEGVQPFIYFQF